MTAAQAEAWDAYRKADDQEPDADAMPAADPALLALANRALGEKVESLESQLSAALADQQAAQRRADALETDLAEICRALEVADAREALSEITHQKLVAARINQDAGDLSRYRDLLDQVASALHCDSIDSIPAVLDRGLAAPEPAGGRLAILTFHEGSGCVWSYLEPHVSEDAAQRHILTSLESGEGDNAILVRALWSAHRPAIQYGAIETPEIKTLRG
jgi:hypothetical protein